MTARTTEMMNLTCMGALGGAIGELYDVAVVPGVTRAMSLSFASNEVLGLVTHDPLDEGALDRVQA